MLCVLVYAIIGQASPPRTHSFSVPWRLIGGGCVCMRASVRACVRACECMRACVPTSVLVRAHARESARACVSALRWVRCAPPGCGQRLFNTLAPDKFGNFSLSLYTVRARARGACECAQPPLGGVRAHGRAETATPFTQNFCPV